MNESVTKVDCRTAPATLGLLNTVAKKILWIKILQPITFMTIGYTVVQIYISALRYILVSIKITRNIRSTAVSLSCNLIKGLQEDLVDSIVQSNKVHGQLVRKLILWKQCENFYYLHWYGQQQKHLRKVDCFLSIS